MKFIQIVSILFVGCILALIYFSGNQTDQGLQEANTTGIEVTRPVVLDSNTTNTSNTTEVTRPVCTVKTGFDAGTVNLRSGSGLSYGVLIVLSEAQDLEYLGQRENGFVRVRLSDKDIDGWIRDTYVNCTNN